METGLKTFQTNSKIDSILNNKLSIQVSLSGLSFCVLNSETNTITNYSATQFDKDLSPKDVLEELASIIRNNKLFQQDFKSVHLIHENELSTFVPKALFNDDHIADYLKFNSKILSNDYITHDDLTNGDIVNVYVPYVNINNFFLDIFGVFEFNHCSTLLLNAIYSMHKNKSESTMYINVANQHFEIIVLEGSKLMLYNTFVYHTKEDFIYYILFTAEQLQFNPEEFPLILLGNVSENDELYKIAYTYIRHIRIHEAYTNFNFETDNIEGIRKNFIMQNSF